MVCCTLLLCLLTSMISFEEGWLCQKTILSTHQSRKDWSFSLNNIMDMKPMVNLRNSWRYKREISSWCVLQGTYLWLYLVRRLLCTPKFTSVHAFIVTNWRRKKHTPKLAPGTDNQMDRAIDFAPLKSIDFDLYGSIFTIRFGPNNRSHPLKSIIKANNPLPGSL